MCMTRSFIVTKTEILSHPKMDSHESIIELHKLNDSGHTPDFVRVELRPTKDLEDLASWSFKVDQDRTPDWWSAKEAEESCRGELKKWVDSHGWNNIPGDLNLQGCLGLSKLPYQLCSVGGYLYLRGTAVKDLGSLQSVGGYLDLQGTAVTELPTQLKVAREVIWK